MPLPINSMCSSYPTNISWEASMIPPDAADEVVAHRRTQDGHDDATGLSRIEQDDSELTKCIFELYAIQAIERNNDDRFPLDL